MRAHRLGNFRHYYYWSDLKSDGDSPIDSSSEFIVIDSIKSVPEYARNLDGALAAAETETKPLNLPAKDHARVS